MSLIKYKYYKSTIESPFHESIIIEEPVRIEKNVTFGNQKMQLGCYSFIGKNSVMGVNAGLIGRYCSISQNCIIGPNNHPLDKISTSACFYSPSWGLTNNDYKSRYNGPEKNTILKNDVWVGANSIILSGVQVGNGAVVGSGSVVTKDVEDYAIVVGAPAKIIRYRFNEETRARLIASQWWKLDPKIVLKYWEDPIEVMLEKLESLKSQNRTFVKK